MKLSPKPNLRSKKLLRRTRVKKSKMTKVVDCMKMNPRVVM